MKRKWFCLLLSFLIFILPITVSPYLPIGIKDAEAADIFLQKSTQSPGIQMAPRTGLVFGATDTSKTLTIDADGVTHTIIVELPDWTTGSPTATLAISNSDGKLLYSITGLTENTGTSPHILLVSRPLKGTSTFTITLTGQPGGSGGTAYLTIYVE